MTTEQKEFKLCKKCHAYRTPEQFLNTKGRTLKTCTHCREYARKLREKNRCEHNRSKYTCTKCKELKKGTGVKNIIGKIDDTVKIDLSNIENEQRPIVKYDCVDGCPYCTPDICNIKHPGCICKRVRHIVVKKYKTQTTATHKTVKKLYADYIIWLNTTKYSKLNVKQVNAVKCLREFWNNNNHNLDEYYDIKKYHTLINGQSGNKDIWKRYISSAMKMRLRLSYDSHKN